MIEVLIGRVIDREGGYVNHSADRGGPTNMGITLKTLSDWRGVPCTADDVKNMPRDEAAAIYYHRYWSDPGFFTLQRTTLIEDMIFDAAVHHGPARAVRFLQLVAGVQPDGKLGPITREAINKVPDLVLACGFITERIRFLAHIVGTDRSQAAFLEGWMKRATSFIKLFPQLNAGSPFE